MKATRTECLGCDSDGNIYEIGYLPNGSHQVLKQGRLEVTFATRGEAESLIRYLINDSRKASA